MYYKHPLFPEPEGNPIIWRYLDFWKFEHLLQTQTLFFNRADKLIEFDKHEGSLTVKEEKLIFQELCGDVLYKQLRKMKATEFAGIYLFQDKFIDLENIRNKAYETYAYYRNKTYVNCWHINEVENYLMWKSYTNMNDSIAIKTNFMNLIDSLQCTPKEIYISQIQYTDFANDNSESKLGGRTPNQFQIVLDMLFKKTLYFKHENELRLITDNLTYENKYHVAMIPAHINLHELDSNNGMEISIDIDKLIDEIYIAPNANEEFRQQVKNLLIQYNINMDKLKNSALTQ